MNRYRLTLSGAEILAGTALCAALAACAVPATQVDVPTQSMRKALEQSRSERPKVMLPEPPATAGAAKDPPQHVSGAAGPPRPQLATPDVRMAYLYDWVDHEGNQHFGSWVAIPLSGFDWVLAP